MIVSAGLISMGAFIPGKTVAGFRRERLIAYLKNETLLHEAYIETIHTDSRLPGSVETNYDGWERHPWFPAWLANAPRKKQRDPFQGTKERRRVPFDPVSLVESVYPHPMLPSDAETLAGALALVNAGVDRSSIDLLITSSQVPDLPLPPNASLVQHKLQLNNAGAYSVDTCCSSFVTMLEIAEGLVRAGLKNNILIVSSYIDSHVTDKSDYFSVNTGDAAVAGVVSAVDDGYGYVTSHSTSHGGRHDGVILQRRPPRLFRSSVQGASHEQEFVTFHNPETNREIALNARDDMVEVVGKALGKRGMTIGDIDFFVTHQPVYWAGTEWRKGLGIPESKFYETFEKYGNIANCSAPVNLIEAVDAGLIKAGDTTLIASSGAGENHIAVVERISPQLVGAIRGDEWEGR